MTRFVIITPVLNGADFIEANLASVRAQSDSDWVHYLVDGGSTDGTVELLKRAGEEDPRRRVVTGKDKGLYDALFKGFDHAVADGETAPRSICAWLGADDLLMPWAFATLRQQFDRTGAEWITALPTIWDSDGRLVLAAPSNWYPRRLIRAGQFHNRNLGGIQQESIFFTYSLLSKLSEEAITTIRNSKLAGDFILWREFAKYTDLVPIPSAVAGFRKHGANLSTAREAQYFDEIRNAGVRLPPSWLAKGTRTVYRASALLMTELNWRRACTRVEIESSGLPPEPR